MYSLIIRGETVPPHQEEQETQIMIGEKQTEKYLADRNQISRSRILKSWVMESGKTLLLLYWQYVHVGASRYVSVLRNNPKFWGTAGILIFTPFTKDTGLLLVVFIIISFLHLEEIKLYNCLVYISMLTGDVGDRWQDTWEQAVVG